jgi:glycine hydroxymethyltransferase
LRLGTPAVTTRGMKEGEMGKIAQWIFLLLTKKEKPATVKQQTIKLCQKFPLPIK